MGSSNYGKFLKRRAKSRVLADGQGARKRKPKMSHRGTNGRRHKESFGDLGAAR